MKEVQNQVGLPPASPARTLHDRQTSRDPPELHSRHSSPGPICHHLDASCRRLPATCCTICARASQAEQPVCPTHLPGGYALPSPTRSSCKSSKGAGRSRLRAGQLDSRIRLKSQARCEAHCSRSQGGASPQLLREPGGRVPWANPSREGSQSGLGRCTARQVCGRGRGAVCEPAPGRLWAGRVGMCAGLCTAIVPAPLSQVLARAVKLWERAASRPGRRCASSPAGVCRAVLLIRLLCEQGRACWNSGLSAAGDDLHHCWCAGADCACEAALYPLCDVSNVAFRTKASGP